MNKKVLTIILVLISIILIGTPISYANIQPKINIIKQSAENMYLENEQGYLNKRIISVDNTKGEVNIEVSLANKKEEQENIVYENTEIFILIPLYHNEEKKNEYATYIEEFSEKVFKENEKTKIGIIGLKGTISDGVLDENGNLIHGENDQSEIPGTADDSELVVNLTNEITELTNGIQNMNSENTDYYINLQAGIRFAKDSYSSNANKILISLYDNVPNIAIGVNNHMEYGGMFSEYATAEEAIIGKNKEIVEYTKEEILSLKENNIDFILLRPDDTSFNRKWYDSDTGELILDFDGSPYVKELYGSLENPTYGKMYSLNNASLETIINDYIYKDVLEKVGTTIDNTIIKDYFPQEIIDNFDIAFKGSENIDTTMLQSEHYITWNIGDVDTNETVTLEYTLKLKNINGNKEILDKNISVSEKVEVNYVDYNEKEQNAVLTSSPIIKLTEETANDENENTGTNGGTNNGNNSSTNDDTSATVKFPQTGLVMTLTISIIVLTAGAVFAYFKYSKLKDI